MPIFEDCLLHWLTDIDNFSRLVINLPLRQYQLEPARAILDSILHNKGLTFVVMMSRQAGKNELSAQLEAYVLNLYQREGGSGVKASPTDKPQTVNSILRLEDRLKNDWNRKQYRKREGYIFELGAARWFMFSAHKSANVVGATASLLMECDEAQDVDQAKWDKEFTPMQASTNATNVFYGTAWTSNTFLAQMEAYAAQQQQQDGIQRVFKYDAHAVSRELPQYGKFVAAQVARLGRQHPLIKTQFFLETIDSAGGLFPKRRRALMRGHHQRRHEPEPGHTYALLIDVAGEDENEGDEITRAMLENPKRDATALTVVDVDRTGPLPVYRCVDRRFWLGTKHTTLYSQILALTKHWHAYFVVVDATGVGAGLTSFLTPPLGEKLIPVEFSSNIKSELGWGFLGMVETGRWQDYIDDHEPATRQFWYEVEACKYEIRPGPGKLMRWGVWESPGYDGLVARGHDDLLINASLAHILDNVDWPGQALGEAVYRPDLLEDIDAADW